MRDTSHKRGYARVTRRVTDSRRPEEAIRKCQFMRECPTIAVVVVNYRTPDLALQCLAALRAERVALPSLTAVLVDGGSDDASAETLRARLDHPDFRDWVTFLPLALNGGFGWANNQAILMLARQSGPPDYLYLLNPDTQVQSGAVERLMDELKANPACGAAGSQLLSSNGQVAASAFRFPSLGREFTGAAHSPLIARLLGIDGFAVHASDQRDVDWVSGASVMLRTAALRDTGLFDDGFFLYFEEVELLHRLKAKGWSVRHVPSSVVVHIEGAATGLGAAAAQRPYPPYWYQSRRRYFERTAGTSGLIAANLCALAGHALSQFKRFVGRPPGSASFRTADHFRSGFWPSGAAARPSIAQIGDAPGQPPAWMSKT